MTDKIQKALNLAEEALQTLSFEDVDGFFTAYDAETDVTDPVKPALAATASYTTSCRVYSRRS